MKTKTAYTHSKVHQLSDEALDDKSMTIPDLSLTVRQIIERHTRGLGLPSSMPVAYDGDEDQINWDDDHEAMYDNSLDLVEKKQLLDKAKSRVDNLKNTLAAIETAKANRAAARERASAAARSAAATSDAIEAAATEGKEK